MDTCDGSVIFENERKKSPAELKAGQRGHGGGRGHYGYGPRPQGLDEDDLATPYR